MDIHAEQQPKRHTKSLIIVLSVIAAFFSIFFFTVYSSYRDIHAIKLFNPLATELIVQINKDKYSLQPNEQKSIHPDAGNYNVKSWTNGKLLVDTVITISPEIIENSGLINLSGEPLYLVSLDYKSRSIIIQDSFANEYVHAHPETQSTFESMKSLAALEGKSTAVADSDFNIVVVDSNVLYGPIKEYRATQYVIRREWEFDATQPFKEKVDASDAFEMGRKVSKLFTKQGILIYSHHEPVNSSKRPAMPAVNADR